MVFLFAPKFAFAATSMLFAYAPSLQTTLLPRVPLALTLYHVHFEQRRSRQVLHLSSPS